MLHCYNFAVGSDNMKGHLQGRTSIRGMWVGSRWAMTAGHTQSGEERSGVWRDQPVKGSEEGEESMACSRGKRQSWRACYRTEDLHKGTREGRGLPGVTQAGRDRRDSYPGPLICTVGQPPTTGSPEALESGGHGHTPLPRDWLPGSPEGNWPGGTGRGPAQGFLKGSCSPSCRPRNPNSLPSSCRCLPASWT